MTVLKNLRAAPHILLWVAMLVSPLAALASSEPVRNLVVLGDSIAAGYGVEPEEAFPALLQEKIDQAKLGYHVINAGVSGDTTAGGLRRLDWLLRQPVHVLVLELGGNDGLRGIPPEETKKNLTAIVAKTREKHPGTKIVIAGMQMPRNMGESYTTAFREVFGQVAKESKASLIPFLLEGVGGKSDLNQPDRIHPNPQGHRLVSETVWKVLEPILRETKPGSPP